MSLKSIFQSIRSSYCSSSRNQSPDHTKYERSASDTTPPPTYRGNLAIIELFQSQGCNSCPPTNDNLTSLACPPSQYLSPLPRANSNGADYLLLTYHVTYWDYLGWLDMFAKKEFDARQREYVQRLNLHDAFTPQVIVNGRASGVGNSERDLGRVLQRGGAGETLPIEIKVLQNIRGEELSVSVDSTREGTAEWRMCIVWYDPRAMNVKIWKGENAGKTLPHQNVVKNVQCLGLAREGKKKDGFVVRRSSEGLEGVVLLHDGPGGRILGAARI